jgi:gluconate 2-dehydrogenase subunit 3-like protein
MVRIRLPRFRALRAEIPAPFFPSVDLAAERSPAILLSRRQFLKALGALLAALATPVTWAERAFAAARGRFLTRRELATLEALCDRILPPDQDPGAQHLGAAAYIDHMLAAFDPRVPRIFAGGPFSNRNPFPDNEDGTASHRRPRDAFRRFIPLTRTQELRWRAELFGSASLPGADFNDAALGALRGLRDVYREGLATVNQAAQMMGGRPFAQLSPDDQDRVFRALDTGHAFAPDPRRGNFSFIDLLIQHTLEGCFAAPEYGGNRRSLGWRMLGLEGDDQPLGYSLFSTAKQDYNERPDHPMSTPNPDEIDPASGALRPRPITADAAHVQQSIITLSGLFGE